MSKPKEETNRDNAELKPTSSITEKLRDKGSWECDISEVTPLKRVECVSMFAKLSSGLTPYELMNGRIESDTRYSQTNWDGS